jgi:glycosyltransferase involved in cell wall biosynthesis
VQPILDAADVFALTSLWEALPFSLLEAMACGLPVVASAVAGNSELVTLGVTGELVPPKDSKATAAALRRILGAPTYARAAGEAGRARVASTYSIDAMLSATFRLYERLLASA